MNQRRKCRAQEFDYNRKLQDTHHGYWLGIASDAEDSCHVIERECDGLLILLRVHRSNVYLDPPASQE